MIIHINSLSRRTEMAAIVAHEYSGGFAYIDADTNPLYAVMADVIKAAGGLVWREDAGVRKLAVIHRARHDDWTLPKGKLEPGEDWAEAAVREVREETGCDARIEEFAGEVRYAVNGRPKIVRFWNMSLEGPCDFHPSEEVEALVWMTIPDALERIDYDGERNLISQSHGKRTSSTGA